MDDQAGGIDFDYVKALEATRPLILEDLGRRLGEIQATVDSCDSECDRALMEIWRLVRWIEGRVARNSPSPA